MRRDEPIDAVLTRIETRPIHARKPTNPRVDTKRIDSRESRSSNVDPPHFVVHYNRSDRLTAQSHGENALGLAFSAGLHGVADYIAKSLHIGDSPACFQLANTVISESSIISNTARNGLYRSAISLSNRTLWH